MRKNCIVSPKFFLIIIVFMIFSCRKKTEHHVHDIGKITLDSNLKRLAQSSNQQIVADIPLIKALKQTKILTVNAQAVVNFNREVENNISTRVNGRIEKLYINFNNQPVRKGQLIMELYAPDLAAAQQELIFLISQQEHHNLIAQAQQRLLNLGMSNAQIQQVIKRKKVDYKVLIYSNYDGFIVEKSEVVSANNQVVGSASGTMSDGMAGAATTSETIPIQSNITTQLSIREGQYVSAGQSVFQIYNPKSLIAEVAIPSNIASLINKGQKVLISNLYDKEHTLGVAKISKIEPNLGAESEFVRARIYLNEGTFKIGELLQIQIPLLVESALWLPQSAVNDMGNKHVVFRKIDGFFEAVEVKIGIKDKQSVQIMTAIEGWDIAENASYLLDNEGFIKIKK